MRLGVQIKSMKKVLKSTVLIILLILLATAFLACGGNTNDDKTADERTINSIDIDTSALPQSITVGSLDLSVIKVVIYYSDNTKESVSLTEDMISLSDKQKLNTAGTQTINVIYNDLYSKKFQIKLVEQGTKYYTLTVDGGYPVEINGEQIQNPVVKEGVFAEEFSEGTKIKIIWKRIDNQEFVEWTDNGHRSVNSMITEVTMTGNHSLVAVTQPIVHTVTFFTNGADTSTLAPKRTDMLNAIDINGGKELTKEGYVFDGWTTTPVTDSDGSAYNCTEAKIVFPYTIIVETQLYATWRPLGLEYQNDGSGGYWVTGYNLELADSKTAPKALNIPLMHNNCYVTGIKASAFEGKEAAMLQSVYISERVSYIEQGAFKNCISLQKIQVNENSPYFQSIDGAVYSADLETLLCYPSDKIADSYTVQQTVTEIADYAFKDALVGSIALGSNIVRIGTSAFDSAHIDNMLMQYITFESSSDFANDMMNDNIRKILVSNTYLGQFKGLFDYQIENKLTTEQEDILLVTVKLNANKTMLYRIMNFDDAYKTAYEGIEIMGVERSLTSFTVLPELNGRKIFSIGNKAFGGCMFLKDVIIPDDSNLARIGTDAFSDTEWIEKYNKDKALTLNNILYKYLGTEENSYEIPATVKKIADSAFENNTCLKSIDFSNASLLTFIGAYAFQNCVNLTGTVTLLPSVEVIHKYAFANTNIKAFALADNSELSVLGEYAFYNCRRLKELELSGVIESIDSSAFRECVSLVTFTQQNPISGTKHFTVESDGILYRCDGDGKAVALFKYPAGKMTAVLNIKEGITKLENYSLEHANIGALVIASSVSDINAEAIRTENLIYIHFKSTDSIGNVTYKKIFGDNEIYRPSYIVFDIDDKGENPLPSTEENNIITNFYFQSGQTDEKTFYNDSHSIVCLANYKTDNDKTDNFYIYEYDMNNFRTSIIRTDRTAKIINIPKSTIIENIGETDIKYIKGFAFYGSYLQKVIIEAQLDTIYENAFFKAVDLLVLDLKALNEAPSLENNSLNDKYNNGMVIYIKKGTSDIYVENWNANKKYLLEDATAIATFKSSTEEEKWESLTYYNQGSTDTVENYAEFKIDNDIAAANQPVPFRKGYVFLHWQSEEGNILDNSYDYKIPWHTVFYAIWQPTSYHITFDIEDNATMENKEINIEYGKPFTFEKPNYPNKSFVCWKDATGKTYGKDGDESYLIWYTYSENDNITLYPVWEDIKYSINYDLNSLENAHMENKDSVMVIYGKSYSLSVPEKLGYIFNGWSSTPINDGVNLLTDNIGKSLKMWTYSGESTDFIVYAYFTAKSDYHAELYIDRSIYYFTETNITYGQPFCFSYDESKISDAEILESYPFIKFCGWQDENGNRITDEKGYCDSWKFDSEGPIKIYAIWPLVINTQQDFDAWLVSENKESSSVFLNTDIEISEIICQESNTPFSGVFIGNNHNITFNYTANVISGGIIALFGNNSGTIRDIRAEINIVVNDTSNDGSMVVGGVAGINKGKIYSLKEKNNTDIDIKVNLAMTITDGMDIILGGIVGQNYGIVDNISMNVDTISVEIEDISPLPKSEIILGIAVGENGLGGEFVTSRNAKFYYTDASQLIENVGKNAGGSFSATIIGIEK